jgi:ABC-type transport system substrate-binding protein
MNNLVKRMMALLVVISFLSPSLFVLNTHAQEQKYFFEIHGVLRPPYREEFMDLLAKEMAKIGVKYIPEPVEASTWIARFDNKTWAEGGYDLIFAQHGWQRYDPRIGYDFYATRGYHGYDSGELYRLVQESYKYVDFEKAKPYVMRITEIFAEDNPILCITWPKDATVMRSGIEGYQPLFSGERLAGLRFVTVKGSTAGSPVKLIYAQGGDVAAVSPFVIGDAYSFPVAALCFDKLIYTDNDFKPVIPGLAKSWEFLEGGTKVVLHLRDNVLWHDGSKFTSSDVKYTIETTFNPVAAAAYRTQYLQFADKLKSIETPDETTVILNFKEVHGTLLVDLAKIYIQSQRLWKDVPLKDIQNHAYARSGPVVGTGAFKFKQWVKGQYIEFEANKDYWGGKPAVDQFFLRFIPERATAVAALKAEEVDWLAELYSLNVELDDLRKDSRFKVVDFLSGILDTAVGVNCRHPILQNKWVRKAINYVFPRDHIANNIMRGMAQPANQLCAPGNWGYNPNLPKSEYSIEKARECMQKAGYNYESIEAPKALPLSTYLLPFIGGVAVGAIIVSAVILVRKKKS